MEPEIAALAERRAAAWPSGRPFQLRVRMRDLAAFAADRPQLPNRRSEAVGAMPICGEDNRLKGMVTDRDLVVKVLAQGKDPASTQMSELATQGEVVTVGADDPVEEILRTMTEHKVRRLPVIDGRECVGIVSQADVATNLDETDVGELVESISAAP